MPSISGTCDVCSGAPSKYRCPTCEVLYCSLNCYKGHKDVCKAVGCKEPHNTHINGASRNHNQKTEKEEGELSERESDMEDEDRVEQDILQQLGESEELKSLLHNPHLRQLLSHLDQSDNKEKNIADAMQEPLFLEFADQALKIVAGDDARTIKSTRN